MALSVRTLEYFYIRVADEPGKAYELLAKLAAEEINLLAFSAVPYGHGHVELTVFPDSSARLIRVAEALRWSLTGPQHAGVSIYASSGITDGTGHYGYVIYFKEGDHVAATAALAR